ncbi:MAG: nitrile hydratase subunit alpha [Gemmataceae bacterium]|nr:nitrile hydratase subunit alpha [Gemmataceae bacterium]
MHADHDHVHPHRHPPQPDVEDTPSTYYQRLEEAVRELLIAKGIFTGEDIRRTLEIYDSQSPVLGGKVVARAWVDPAYKARLLADGSKAVEELGIPMDTTKLVVVENTPAVHNVIVCTLCSCYPRPVLGLPPDWYKSRNYRSRTVREPRAVLAEFGTQLPDGVDVRVHDSTADMRYLVLPMRPAGTEGMEEAALAELVTRDSMIGVSLPRAAPVTAP